MKKLLATLLVGALLGSVATYHLLPSAPQSHFLKVVKHDIQDVPHISAEEARFHREERYESIRTIEDMLALPTDFAETEALFVVAGRADSGEVQNLIYQAARIRDRSDRTSALEILFLRLTELDPLSAIAITRTPAFANNQSQEGSVWAAWGKLDLDAALTASADGNAAQKNLAAQSLYTSLDSLDSGDADRIREILGAHPGRNARTQHLYAMAEESSVAAVRYIESSGTLTEQREQFAMLALHMSQSGKSIEPGFSDLIQSAANRKMFALVSASYGSQGDPETALKKALAEPMDQQSQMLAFNSLQQLATNDPEAALEYFGQFPDINTRQNQMMAAMVMGTIANKNPQKALAWVRENDSSSDHSLLVNTLAQIAQNDPQLAIAEAHSIESQEMRDRIFSKAVMNLSHIDPEQALPLLSEISGPSSRQTSIDRLAQSWAQSDFDSAIEWVATLDPRDQRRTLENMAQSLVYSNIDQAVELLDKLPAAGSKRLTKQIAQNLTQQRSIDSALSFIEQYKGHDEYLKLHMSVITSAAAKDPAQAMQMARSIEDPKARDQLFGSIASQQVARDSQLALRSRESIVDEKSRATATAQMARKWYAADSVAATQWLNGLARGAERDDAIATVVNSRREHSSTEIEALIDSIGDANKRKATIMRQIRSLAQVDAVAAEQRLSRVELNDSDRKKLQKAIDDAHYKY